MNDPGVETFLSQRTNVVERTILNKEELTARDEADSGSRTPTISDNAFSKSDPRFEFVRQYLLNVYTVLNQHTSHLSDLQTDVKAKITQEILAEIMGQLASSSTLKDIDLNRLLATRLEDRSIEETGDSYRDSINSFSNRLKMFAEGFSYFYRMNNDFSQRFERLEAALARKADDAALQVKLVETKLKLQEETHKNLKALEDRVVDTEIKLREKFDVLQEHVVEVEKQTLWRIKDCEGLLKSRVNSTYVEESIKTFETKFRQEMHSLTTGKNEEMQKVLDDALKSIKQSEEVYNQKVVQMKKNIKDIEKYLANKAESSKFEELEKNLFSRVEALSDGVKEVERRLEPCIERAEVNVKKNEAHVDKLSKRIEDLAITIENYMLGGGGGGSSNKTKNRDSILGPKDVSEVQVVLTNYREKIEALSDNVEKIENILEDKINLNTLRIELSHKVDQLDADRLASRIRNLEARFDKLPKEKTGADELTQSFNSVWKHLKQKADDAKVQKAFENIDVKILSITETFHLLKKELDQSSSMLQKISAQTSKLTESRVKGPNTQVCLTCGQAALPMISTHNMVSAFKMRPRDHREEFDDSSIINDNPDLLDNKYENKTSKNELNSSYETKALKKVLNARNKIPRVGLPRVEKRSKTLTSSRLLDTSSVNMSKNYLILLFDNMGIVKGNSERSEDV